MRVDIPRLVLALVFYVHENNYFGWNRHPMSPEECIADGIFVLLLALAFGRQNQAAA